MKNTVLVVLSCLTVLCGCALQRDVVTLDDRLASSEQRRLELESRIDAYSKAQEQSDQNIRGKSASQNAMIDGLREEIQILTGRLEETEYLLKQQIEFFKDSDEERANQLNRIDQTTSLNQDRIVRLEQYLNFESTGADSSPKSDSQAGKELSEDKIYRLAKQAFDQGDFEAAREGFQKLIKQYPKSGHADNSQFWIGEIYYREKWYEKAILEYQKVIEKYPRGNKVQASLLKQGFAFFNLGDKANARLILTELVKKYPKSNEAKIAKHKLKGLSP
ncbi:MAG: tol-pal system protein YbgF [Desulfobacterales bacterium PC51MH44]|nr:MAG: tol-pal system protein YbgF [Desulfobacterales bacterium PC51MH44]